jgi:2TM domain
MTTETDPASEADEVTEEREEARQRVQAKRDFGSHLVAYIVINAFLIGVWAITGAGYFWPAWILACWGAGLILHAWDVYWRRPVTEADVNRELRRHRR